MDSSPATTREDISFPTIDGLEIRGTLFRAGGREPGPAIILTPGFNCTKEMFVPDVALYFQRAGFTALTYDPRTTGSSGGHPRNDIDPNKQVEDYSDALSYLSGIPFVNPDKIVLWGYSFAGAICLSAASIDSRAAAVIAVCPLTQFEYTTEKLPKVLKKCIQDRESQLLGNAPFYLPMLTSAGENPAGFGVGIEKDNYQLLTGAKETIAPTFENRTTIQTYSRLFRWRPFQTWKNISPTPVMFVIAELDLISPPELQRSHFESLAEPKKLLLAAEKGHMDVLSGKDVEQTLQEQLVFAKSATFM